MIIPLVYILSQDAIKPRKLYTTIRAARVVRLKGNVTWLHENIRSPLSISGENSWVYHGDKLTLAKNAEVRLEFLDGPKVNLSFKNSAYPVRRYVSARDRKDFEVSRRVLASAVIHKGSSQFVMPDTRPWPVAFFQIVTQKPQAGLNYKVKDLYGSELASGVMLKGPTSTPDLREILARLSRGKNAAILEVQGLGSIPISLMSVPVEAALFADLAVADKINPTWRRCIGRANVFAQYSLSEFALNELVQAKKDPDADFAQIDDLMAPLLKKSIRPVELPK